MSIKYRLASINLNHSNALCTKLFSSLSTHLELQWQWDGLTGGPLRCGVAEKSRTADAAAGISSLNTAARKKNKFRCVIFLYNTEKKNSNVILQFRKFYS